MANDGQSRCAIARTGVAVARDGRHIVLDIEGKVIRLPSGRAAADVKAGDAVRWSGERWTKAEPSAES